MLLQVIVSWNWNFGDNNLSNAINPIYTYDDSAGITQVELIVIDDNDVETQLSNKFGLKMNFGFIFLTVSHQITTV